MSEFRTKLIVAVEDDHGTFTLVRPLTYYSDLLGREITVPEGFKTDFASIPWVFHSFVQVNGKHRPAAVLHDYLCTISEEWITQKNADRVFLEAMEVLGVRWSQRRVMYRAVRIYQSIAAFFK